MNLTDDEIIVMGTFCETVLDSALFSTLTTQYETSTVQQLLSTKPQDRIVRDQHYYAVRGVRDFLSLMAHYVAEKHRLIELEHKPSEDLPAEDEDV